MGIRALEDGLFANLLIFEYLYVFRFLLGCFLRSTGSGRHLILFLLKFHVKRRQNHVWGPPGARVMSIFIKTYIFLKATEGKGREKGKGERSFVSVASCRRVCTQATLIVASSRP